MTAKTRRLNERIHFHRLAEKLFGLDYSREIASLERGEESSAPIAATTQLMNNNTKKRWKLLKKRDRQRLAEAGRVRKSTRPKVGGRS